MSPLQNLAAQALRLSAPYRKALADALLQSLDQAALDEIDPAWIEEAERRYQDWRSERVQGIAERGFFDGVRQELGWRLSTPLRPVGN